ALKDPRTSPAKPFYIGKGVGTRAWDHLLSPDETAKGKRIAEILNSGTEVLVTVVCDDLTEVQALKIEAELIASLGMGVTNSDVCHSLGLHSNYAGGSKDYLSWSVLGLLMQEGRLRRVNSGQRGYHQAQVR